MDTDSINVEVKLWIRNVNEDKTAVFMDVEVFADNKYVTGETNKKVYLNQAEWISGWVDVPSNY